MQILGERDLPALDSNSSEAAAKVALVDPEVWNHKENKENIGLSAKSLEETWLRIQLQLYTKQNWYLALFFDKSFHARSNFVKLSSSRNQTLKHTPK